MISSINLSASSQSTPSPLLSPALSTATNSTESSAANSTFTMNNGKTTAYTYEAFFASDGRSRKKNLNGSISASENSPPMNNGRGRHHCCRDAPCRLGGGEVC